MQYQSLEDAQHEAWLSEQRASEELAFLRFLTKHQEIAPVEANKRLLREFIGDDSLITVGLLEDSLPFLRDSLALRAPNQIKRDAVAEQQQLWNELLAAGASLDDKGGFADKRIYRLSNDQLKAKIAELRDRARLSQLSRKELKVAVREEFAAAHPNRAGASNFEPLPDDVTAKSIKLMSAQQIRDLQKRHGNAAVNARLRGE